MVTLLEVVYIKFQPQTYESAILTVTLFPLPKAAAVKNCLSVEEAATVKIQGATFSTDMKRGPLLPAEQVVRIPLVMAWNAPMAMGSLRKLCAGPPMETERKLTPSAMAWSKPASMSMSLQPEVQQTLYIARRADGTPPLDVPLPTPNRLAPFTTEPAAIDAV